MAQSPTHETPLVRGRRALRTPRAAAVAGIPFAVLFGSSIVLIRLSSPAGRALAGGRPGGE